MPLLRGGARAVRSVATNTVTDPFGGPAFALISGGSKAIRACKTTWVGGGALRVRTVRICAMLPAIKLKVGRSTGPLRQRAIQNYSPPTP